MSALDDQAYSLMQSAVSLIPKGKWKEAAKALEQAAALHADTGRTYDQARCLQLAATLRRSSGDTDRARTLIKQASEVAPGNQPLEVSILAEQAETAFSEGRYDQAASAWTAAIEKGRLAGLKADGLSALLLRRAATFSALDMVRRAADDFDQAYQLLDAARGREVASFVRVEQAGQLLQHGHLEEAARILDSLEAELQRIKSLHLMAEFLVLRAKMAHATGKMDEAEEYARRSRDAALEAVAPVSYFAASVELADVLQGKGNHSGAYGTLAMALVTLSDLLGKDVAYTWVEPILIAYRIKWGRATFEQAKGDYEAGRRAMTGQ